MLPITQVDVSENVYNRTFNYTVSVLFADGNRDIFILSDIESINRLKNIIFEKYNQPITHDHIFFYVVGLDEPYQVSE